MSLPICSACLEGTALPGEPKGQMIKVGGTDTYLASPPTSSTTAASAPGEGEKKAVVLFTDVLGLPLGNSQLIADLFAEKLGLEVYVPDMFLGHPPISPEQMSSVDHWEIGTPRPFSQKLRMYWLLLGAVPSILFSHSTGKVTARMLAWCDAVRKERGVEKLGAVGHCYGGMVIVKIAAARQGVLQAGVVCHPGRITKDEVEKIDFPCAWATCEEDDAFPPSFAAEVESTFAARPQSTKVPYEFVFYKGTKHGFAARPALHIKEVREAWERVTEQSWRWLEKYL